MGRRLALARALACGGGLYLLDEPFTGVDAARAARILERVRARAVLLCHEAEVALCDLPLHRRGIGEAAPERRVPGRRLNVFRLNFWASKVVSDARPVSLGLRTFRPAPRSGGCALTSTALRRFSSIRARRAAPAASRQVAGQDKFLTNGRNPLYFRPFVLKWLP
ncbi:MAG: hypothetical protein ACLURW_00810 [Flavonifractor plautii]